MSLTQGKEEGAYLYPNLAKAIVGCWKTKQCENYSTAEYRSNHISNSLNPFISASMSTLNVSFNILNIYEMSSETMADTARVIKRDAKIALCMA